MKQRESFVCAYSLERHKGKQLMTAFSFLGELTF